MNYNRWYDDAKLDTELFLLFQDLTTILSDQANLTFEYAYGSAIDATRHIVTGSKHWDIKDQKVKTSGYKTDIFLRTIGTLHFTDVLAIKTYVETIHTSSLRKFAIQLITLLEDLRIEEQIKKARPGTKNDFSIRKTYLKHYFSTQLATNVTRSYPLDELFCLIYLLLQAEEPDPDFPSANEKQLNYLTAIKPLLYDSFAAKSTSTIARIAEEIVSRLEENYLDMVNEYFTLPITTVELIQENTLFDELTRTDDVANIDQEEVNQENNQYIDERFSTWHRENQNSDRKQTFLRFELDVGTKTNLMGGATRETEDADQAMGTIQGASGKSDRNDFSKLESLQKQTASHGKKADKTQYGDANKDAVAIIKEASHPSKEDIELYQSYANDIDAYKRKLAGTIDKILEHKKNAARKDLAIGRLSKKLLPLVMDENPRVFYKKDQEANEIDAVFSLLVDCSASMHDKMEETKRGIVLFHEVLNTLKIPHAIVGFWEDANEVKEHYQPNYFHIVHGFTDSFYEETGAKIMQLKPEEDNRDGFSIRIMAEKLTTRREKHKFILVFSDGEPAASGYEQNGVMDTTEAVFEARKKGIEVIGMFLANGEINERDDMLMENIYGRERLMIPSVAELPEEFAPLLKKLLLKAM